MPCHIPAVISQSQKALKANTRTKRKKEKVRGRGRQRETDKSNGRMPSSKQKSNNNKILYCSVNNSIVSLNSTRQRQPEKTGQETETGREWESSLSCLADKDRKYAQMKREIKNKLPQNNIK